MTKGYKKCVYITADNMEFLENQAKKSKKGTLSNVLNIIVKVFKNAVLFKKRKNNEGYKYVIVSMRPELIELLKVVKQKYGDDAVVELINLRLLEEFEKQNKQERRRFPDRSYAGDKHIAKLGERCKKYLEDMKKGNTFFM
jgi:hypothetical protein